MIGASTGSYTADETMRRVAVVKSELRQISFEGSGDDLEEVGHVSLEMVMQ